VSEGRFDLVILDNRFADGSGVELCGWVKEQTPDTPVII
jgi:DNA-binding response OmpR family regulator